MKNLTNAQIIELRDHSKKLEELEKKIEARVNNFNQTMLALMSQIDSDVDSYRRKLAEANEFLSNVHEKMQEHFEDSSNEWQESSSGKYFQQWIQEWDEPLNKLEVHEPLNLSIEGLDASEILDNLAEEPYE